MRALLVIGIFLLFAGTPLLAADAPGGEREVLGDGTCWRYHFTLRPPTVTAASFRAAGQSGNADQVCPRLAMNRTTPPPPAGWQAADFDDASWPRTFADVLNRQLVGKAHSFRASLRGKFAVTDPAAVGTLRLTLKFRGGAVVTLNGIEVARSHLPAGPLADDTPAELYPNDVWVGDDGRAISWRAAWPAGRDRSIGPIELPASALRRGTNVLAIDLRRSPFHPVALDWNDSGHPPTTERWVPVGLLGVKLAAAGRGIVPNAGRPAGLQVWTNDRNSHVTVRDYGDPNEALYPVRLVGARNGAYCGQIGVGCDAAIRGLKVQVSDFAGPEGRRPIPASRVSLLYGKTGGAWCDRLLEEPPAEVPLGQGGAAVLPVIARVAIPADAAAGDYRATLTVSAGGRPPTRVPVELHVADWTLPDTANYRTFVSMYQSPETVALTYKVDMWSEAHWQLLEQSWRLLGRAANKVAIVHAVEQTQYGNDHSTIFWVPKADAALRSGASPRSTSGSYDWDFSVFDRYLDLAARYCGRLEHVALQITHVGNTFNSNSGWAGNPADQVVTVTTKDPATGKLGSLKAPLFATDEARRFWKPFLAAVNDRLVRRGLQGTLCIGMMMDVGPPPAMVRMFDEIWPDGDASRWMRGCHVPTDATAPYRFAKDCRGVVVLHEYCYGGGVKQPRLGEARGYPGAYYFRNAIAETNIPLSAWMTFGDYCLYVHGGNKGIGRICLDYWPVGRDDLFNRFPYSSCMQRRPTITTLAWPGPHGALPTARFEALAEGLQECEAVIVVSEALEKHAARLDAALAARCRRVLADRRTYADLAFCEFENRSYGWSVTHPYHHGWQEINRRLYDCAAEVARRVPSPPRPRGGSQ